MQRRQPYLHSEEVENGDPWLLEHSREMKAKAKALSIFPVKSFTSLSCTDEEQMTNN